MAGMRRTLNWILIIAAGAIFNCDEIAAAPPASSSGGLKDAPSAAAHSALTQRVLELIARQLNISVSQVSPTADLVNDLGVDSLDCVEIIMAVEDDFEIAIPDQDAEKFRTSQQIANYIAARQAAEKKPSATRP
jgi:acyl carrier protein